MTQEQKSRLSEKQNARLDEARAAAGALFIAGNIRGLRMLRDTLDFEGTVASKVHDREYANALFDEVDMIEDACHFLATEYAMTTGGGL